MSLSKITSIQKATDDADNQVDTDKGVISDYVRRLSLGPPEEADDAILRANGHEAVLERQFKWISALGLGFSITNSWIGYLVSLQLSAIPKSHIWELADVIYRAISDRI